MDNSKRYTITSACTTLFLSIFKLDTSLMPILFPLFTILIDALIDIDLKIFNIKNIAVYIPIMTPYIRYITPLFVAYLLYKCINMYPYIKDYLENFYTNSEECSIFDVNRLEIIDRYFSANCDLSCSTINIGDPDTMKSILTSNEKFIKIEFTNIPVMNVFIPFYDKVTGVSGKIRWSKEIFDASSACSKCNSEKYNSLPMIYFTIRLTDSEKTPIEYVSDIENYIAYSSEDITLNYIRIHGKDNSDRCNTHCFDFYKGKRLSAVELKESLINSFFHKHKDQVFNYLYKINYEPEFFNGYGQCPRMNLILHGPTGSGKSSFINRIARALNRHIVSIDLSSIKSKETVYDIIQKPSSGFGNYTPSQVVMVFEEFDIAVEQLYERQEIAKSLADKIKNKMGGDNRNPNIKVRFDITTGGNIIEDEDGNIIPDVSGNFRELISQYNDIRKSFMLRDLLDILQGTASVNGTIIFATTNKFEKIQSMCPELFRHGRMTPCYFGYLESEQLNMFLDYYFDKNLSDFPEISFDDKGEINIPTSKLVESALDVKISESDNNKAFEKFRQKLLIV